MTVTWHATAGPALRRLVATAGPAGVIVGRDHAGDVAPLRLFRSEPTRVALVGGVWAARLLAFRSLAVGALVQVATAMPPRWSGLAGLAGAQDSVQIGPAGSTPAAPTDASGSLRPVLQVHDVGAGAVVDRPVLPWHCQLTVVPMLTSHLATGLIEANVVILQRLTAEEAQNCASALRLGADSETKLEQLHDDMLAVVIGGVTRYLWLATTAVEEQLLGPPRRAEEVDERAA